MLSFDSAAALSSALQKVRRRLIPFLCLLYIVAYVDRINVGFAALQMNKALGFSSTTFGLGSGIFFLSYILLEIPSNIVLAHVGARRWIARIMISWGIVSSAMMFVRSAGAFYLLRILLGAAEAGFFPGIVYYLTHWFPARDRARAFAMFMTAALAAGVIGAPVSGALLTLDGALGIHGWQWLFLIEGLPAVLLGIVVLIVLTEAPTEAGWLTAAERQALTAAIADDTARSASPEIAEALRQSRTWLLAVVYFIIPVVLYGVGFWLPQMIKSASAASSNFTVGLMTAIPYACAVLSMVMVGRHSDRTGERRWHVAGAAVATAVGVALAPLGFSVWWTVGTLSIAMSGVGSMLGPFWALTTATMRGTGAAAAIALVNSIGNAGGFVGPFLLGAINDRTHSFAIGLYTIAGLLVAGGVLVFAVPER
jgi:ACS family tartrate transporter-like MFS transporter